MGIGERVRGYKWFWILSILVLGLDQWSKYWVQTNVLEGTYIFPEPVPVIEGFLYWVHIYNTGAAWGSFSGSSYILGILAIVVLVVMYIFRETLELKRGVMQVVGGLLVGGIVGNFIDRMAYGHVIDFIDVHLPFYRWPAFNVADIGICIGVVLYTALAFFEKSE